MFEKLVLTGACGNLGMALRTSLSQMCKTLVSTDIANAPETLLENEVFVQTDLGDFKAVEPLLKGADMVVHFGAIADERPFDVLLGPNFLGAYNIWEAAHRHGVRRVVYASSIHAVGMCETNRSIDTNEPHRPDTFYGLAKCFAEDLGRMYWEKRGLEAVCLRIFSCTPEPQNARALGSWLSYRDLAQLVRRSLEAPTVGFTVAYGISNNDRAPVSNHKVGFLGYKPQDNAEDWAEEIFARTKQSDPTDAAQMRIGGPFATVPLGESGVAGIQAMSAEEDS